MGKKDVPTGYLGGNSRTDEEEKLGGPTDCYPSRQQKRNDLVCIMVNAIKGSPPFAITSIEKRGSIDKTCSESNR
jgi:hypothetical protein